MSINVTTLSAAVDANQATVTVASATGIAAPSNTVGTNPPGQNVTFLLVENELMRVLTVNGTTIGVERGSGGTQALAHGNTAPVTAGFQSDFPNFAPAIGAVTATSVNASGFSAPVAVSSNKVNCSGGKFHLTGTTVVKTIVAPAGYIQGSVVRIIFDGSGSGLTWDATDNIAVAGTATTAASFVDFIFDEGSGKWHPSRLA